MADTHSRAQSEGAPGDIEIAVIISGAWSFFREGSLSITSAGVTFKSDRIGPWRPGPKISFSFAEVENVELAKSAESGAFVLVTLRDGRSFRFDARDSKRALSLYSLIQSLPLGRLQSKHNASQMLYRILQERIASGGVSEGGTC
jgi:hypothetical protein